MSRVGNSPIKLPDGVNLTTEGARLVAKGSKGELAMALPSNVDVAVNDGVVTVTPREKTFMAALFGVQSGQTSTIWLSAYPQALPVILRLTGLVTGPRCRETSCS